MSSHPEILKKKVQSFLGMCNYFRCFIRDFSTIARPLHDLTKKNIGPWMDNQEQAFKSLKRAIISASCLLYPDPSKLYLLHVDASQYATGGCLMQKDNENRWRPVTFFSKALLEAECNYPTSDREMLAVIHGVSENRQYLLR
jgi:hypothetical protein